MSNVLRLILDEDWLKIAGDSSLLGKLCGELPEKLQLVFPQSSTEYRAKNGGPKKFYLPEFVVPCIITDILWLIQHNVQIEVIMETQW